MYKHKFDVTLYTVRLSVSHKDTFYLEPCLQYEYLGLKRVEFQCKNAEDRANWFIAITKANKEHELVKAEEARAGKRLPSYKP